ncbi:MAG: aminotransferase class III-fold pyridoxal phosphate-dependent enzyme, partial [Nocardioidaceae bacterium]
LAVIDTIENDGLLAHVRRIGALLADGLAEPRVTEIRQAGLLIGLDLAAPVAAKVTSAALAHGFIINDCTPERVRLAPPLILTQEQADAFVAAWPRILDDAFAAEPT